ncbi:hypothetical protein D3C81_1582090 [compost metagenome]
MVMSELVVSFIATTVLVAGSAIAITIRNGTMVQTTSTVMLSWKEAGLEPLALRCVKME